MSAPTAKLYPLPAREQKPQLASSFLLKIISFLYVCLCNIVIENGI